MHVDAKLVINANHRNNSSGLNISLQALLNNDSEVASDAGSKDINDEVEMSATSKRKKSHYTRNTTLDANEAARVVVKFMHDRPMVESSMATVRCALVRTALKQHYGIDSKKSFTSKVKKIAHTAINGTVEDGYQKLRHYLQCLSRDNPGRFVAIMMDVEIM
ncbi:hypothetical protein AC1031_020697 [Aphanomyces cochlioides]|nr:hypothetical protein AC1031_020697 [Aphanomyces cochlioides]